MGGIPPPLPSDIPAAGHARGNRRGRPPAASPAIPVPARTARLQILAAAGSRVPGKRSADGLRHPGGAAPCQAGRHPPHAARHAGARCERAGGGGPAQRRFSRGIAYLSAAACVRHLFSCPRPPLPAPFPVNPDAARAAQSVPHVRLLPTAGQHASGGTARQAFSGDAIFCLAPAVDPLAPKGVQATCSGDAIFCFAPTRLAPAPRARLLVKEKSGRMPAADAKRYDAVILQIRIRAEHAISRAKRFRAAKEEQGPRRRRGMRDTIDCGAANLCVRQTRDLESREQIVRDLLKPNAARRGRGTAKSSAPAVPRAVWGSLRPRPAPAAFWRLCMIRAGIPRDWHPCRTKRGICEKRAWFRLLHAAVGRGPRDKKVGRAGGAAAGGPGAAGGPRMRRGRGMHAVPLDSLPVLLMIRGMPSHGSAAWRGFCNRCA